MKIVSMATLGLATAVALPAQELGVREPVDIVFAAPMQVRAAAGPTFQYIAGEMSSGTPVKGAPYAADAVTESVQTLADGNRIVSHSSASIARDGQGRGRREQSIGNLGPLALPGETPRLVTITDPVSGVNYSLDSVNKIATKLPGFTQGMPAIPVAPPAGANAVQTVGTALIANGSISSSGAGSRVMYFQRSAPGNTASPGEPLPLALSAVPQPESMAVEQLGSKLIEGVQATGTRRTITIPAGQIGNERPIFIIDERWYSNDLQVTVLSERSDPRVGKTTYALKNINRSEPSPALFQVPSDYTVREGPQPFVQKLP
ncbi:MAG: hypothetical protein ABL967_07350 [Bryobacteraceae bacterium]